MCEEEESGIFSYLKPAPIGFNTRTERFKDSSSGLKLGPGSYELAATKIQRQKSRGTTRAEYKEHYHNAPSIPSHENVFGYEETAGNT